MIIKGSPTLDHFSKALEASVNSTSCQNSLYQIHAAPDSLQTDIEIFEELIKTSKQSLVLIHRPDELVLNLDLLNGLEKTTHHKFIFFGDLGLQHPIYKKLNYHILPHPYLSIEITSLEYPHTVGSFTSWGEMRDLKHYLDLVLAFRDLDTKNIQFNIGGTLNKQSLTPQKFLDWLKKSQYNPAQSLYLQETVQIKTEPFIPAFNTQLYHLNGKKRLGESSGSLHRGITIPIIFEANHIEKFEGISLIKIKADEDLSSIEYKRAAQDIINLSQNRSLLESTLSKNLDYAKTNLPQHFCENLKAIFNQTT